MSRAFRIILLLLGAVAVMAALSLWTHPRERVPWRTDFQLAGDEARRTGKPMLLDISATWCGPCQDMRRTTWSDKKVAAALADYVPVQIDLDAHQDLAQRFGADAVPFLAVLDPNGHLLKSMTGELPPDAFLAWLHASPEEAAQMQRLLDGR